MAAYTPRRTFRSTQPRLVKRSSESLAFSGEKRSTTAYALDGCRTFRSTGGRQLLLLVVPLLIPLPYCRRAGGSPSSPCVPSIGACVRTVRAVSSCVRVFLRRATFFRDQQNGTRSTRFFDPSPGLVFFSPKTREFWMIVVWDAFIVRGRVGNQGGLGSRVVKFVQYFDTWMLFFTTSWLRKKYRKKIVWRLKFSFFR